jgi:hypothetical protein
VDLGDSSYKLTGEGSGDYAGHSVSSAGDVDGDGLDDVLIGASEESTGGSAAGAAYLVFAASLQGSTEIDLGDADIKIIGQSSSEAGVSVSSAGDLDGDGLDDLLVGAEGTDDTYVLLGSSLGSASELIMDEDADYVLSGEAGGDYAGTSVSSAGDVDGDGLADILVGAPVENSGGSVAGATYLVLGSSLGSTVQISLADADYKFIGDSDYDYSGTSVSGAGDVDGDGLDDILVGAPGDTTAADYGAGSGGYSAGAVYVILGSSLGSSWEVDLSTADYKLVAVHEYGSLGQSVASAGDVDGDGLDDIVMGAYGVEQTYLLLGSSLGSTSEIHLADADLTLNGSGDRSGYAVDGVGDVDGDGLDDLFISGYGETSVDDYKGGAYLVLASTIHDGGATLDLKTEADYHFGGETSGDRAGVSAAGAGDVDGDGLADLLVGAWGEDSGGSWSGSAYLLLAPNACNTPPRGTVTSIDPESPVEAVDDLVCEIDEEAYDAEGDSITYSFEWEVDGAAYTDAITTYETGDTVPAEDIFTDEVWSCMVTPDDGTDTGGVAVTEVTVGGVVCLDGDSYGDGWDEDGDGMDCEADCYDGSVYFAVCNGSGITWSDTHDACVAAGYDGLASFDSSAEHSFAEGLASTAGFSTVRVGYNDMDSEGTFTWIDGNSSSFTNWRSGEPNNSSSPSGGEDCAQMESHTSYMWNDGYCDHTSIDGFVCSKR